MPKFDFPPVDSLLVAPRRKQKRRVLFVTMPDGDPFDLIGPMTVLREANYFINAVGRPDLSYDFEVVSNQAGVIFEVDGLKMSVTKTCYEVQKPVDTVVFQAIDYQGECLRDEAFISWVRKIAERSRRMVTACIGTYVLAEAGLLNGRRAATHWSAGNDFRSRYPDVLLDDERDAAAGWPAVEELDVVDASGCRSDGDIAGLCEPVGHRQR